jgi:hypothetical protein
LHLEKMASMLAIPTQPQTPENKGLNVVPPAEPDAKIIYSAVMRSERRPVEVVAENPAPITPGRVVVICGAIVLALTGVGGGVAYWMETHRYPVVVAIDLPEKESQKDPLSGRAGPLVPVSPDLVHVTSIALGTPNLTIVNGKRLAEGDWLVVNAPLGAASLRVISIQDGLVRFRHGGEAIDIKLQAATVKPRP